jgi:hypothetical protein
MPTEDPSARPWCSPPDTPEDPQSFRLVDGGVRLSLRGGAALVLRNCGTNAARWRICPPPKGAMADGCDTSRALAEAFVGEPCVRAAHAALHAAGQIWDAVNERIELRRRQLQNDSEIAHRNLGLLLGEAAARYATDRHASLRRLRLQDQIPSGEIPPCLRAVRCVKRLRLSEQTATVYFLLRRGVVVYVGQSTALWPGRIIQHVDEGAKDFDEVWYLEVDAVSALRVESRYIVEFNPEYNRTGKKRAALG